MGSSSSSYFNFLLLILVLFSFYLKNSNSTVVTYDDRALKIDGERKLIIAGSVHYPRSTAEMWPSIIKNAKDGGLNAIETYVFWNAHEPLYRQYDFSANLDLVRFMKAIHSEGLYAILRIGPYVCAEWNYGGFPVWLHNMSPNVTFRTNDAVYMNEMKIFTTLIVDMMKEQKLFAIDGGPIILAQIENEYGNVMGPFGDDGVKYMNWCSNFAESLDIGVPWIMCQQWNAPKPMINTCNGYYCDQFWPDKDRLIPKFWTENWTGWFKGWGDSDPHRTAEDLAFAVGRFYQLRGSLQNYYMYHGGTNFGRTSGGPYIVTSYDYDAPLNEYGLANQPKWGHLKQLHEVLMSIEKVLLYGDFEDTDYGRMMYSTVYRYKGSRVCFFGNSNNRDDVTVDFEGRNITTQAWSISILLDCKTEVYNSARVNVQTNVFDKVTSESNLEWTWRTEHIESIKTHTEKHPPMFAPHLFDQTVLTNDTSDYLWYMTNVDLDENDPVWGQEVNLRVHTKGHILHAFFNHEHIGSHFAKNGQYEFDLERTAARVKHGINTISLLSATVGLPNYGAYFESTQTGLIGSVKLIAPNSEEMDLTTNRWGFRVGIHGMDAKKLYLNKGKRSWKSSIQVNRPLVWYKTSFETPSGEEPVVLDLEDLGKGTAWVNGNNIGRYWPSYMSSEDGCNDCDYRGAYAPNKCRTNCGNQSQRWYHVPRSFLNSYGKNNLVLFEEFGGNPQRASIQTVSLVKVCAYAYEGTTLNLSCSEGKTFSHVNFASYGDPYGVCGAYKKGSCESEKSQALIEQECLGRNSCKIDVSDDTFGATHDCDLPNNYPKRRLAVAIICN